MTHGNGGPKITTEKTSRRWSSGTPQKTQSWCFAAAEETVQHAFGNSQISQEQIAHDVLFARGEIGDDEGGEGCDRLL